MAAGLLVLGQAAWVAHPVALPAAATCSCGRCPAQCSGPAKVLCPALAELGVLLHPRGGGRAASATGLSQVLAELGVSECPSGCARTPLPVRRVVAHRVGSTPAKTMAVRPSSR